MLKDGESEVGVDVGAIDVGPDVGPLVVGDVVLGAEEVGDWVPVKRRTCT